MPVSKQVHWCTPRPTPKQLAGALVVEESGLDIGVFAITPVVGAVEGTDTEDDTGLLDPEEVLTEVGLDTGLLVNAQSGVGEGAVVVPASSVFGLVGKSAGLPVLPAIRDGAGVEELPPGNTV